MYHQAMDECQRLQSENVALRQMLQHALEHGPRGSPRSSSRGHNHTSRGTDCVMSVLKPHMSFVAEHESAHGTHGQSCSPNLSRYCQLDPVYENVFHATASCFAVDVSIAYLYIHSSICSYVPDNAAFVCLCSFCKDTVYLSILQNLCRTGVALPLCTPAWRLYEGHS